MGNIRLRKLFAAAALLLLSAGALSAQTPQTLTVKGTVVDKDGTPVPGAFVVVVGTMNGATSDNTGAWTLSKVKPDAELSVDLLGYKTQLVPVQGRTDIRVVLEDDTTFLDEVVVVGYGQMKKSDLTGSVATVKPEALTDVPANSIDGLLQGRVAGVQVINASQDPGASSTIRIRGNSSLNGSNSPLVVIDGFPYGDAAPVHVGLRLHKYHLLAGYGAAPEKRMELAPPHLNILIRRKHIYGFIPHIVPCIFVFFAGIPQTCYDIGVFRESRLFFTSSEKSHQYP